MTGERDYFETNRAMWDERVPIHVGGRFYDVDGFKAGGETLREFELAELGDVSGKDLLHLQCHFGKDTLSWARRGARVTGLDFSAPAIEAARRIAAEAGLEADFVAANVYDAVEALGGRSFDVAYTGLGALNWLPDLARWAEVVAALVRPGGVLYLSEFHPLSDILADDELVVAYPYFHREPLSWDEPGTYADLEATTSHNRSFEWIHPLSEAVTVLLDAGFTLELLHEHDYTLFPRWPFLEQEGPIYRLPADRPALPLMYSLRARRAGDADAR